MERNGKWKIPRTILGRRGLCFSSYKNHKLKEKKLKLKEKRDIFCTVHFAQREFFQDLCFISMCSVSYTLSEYRYFYMSKKHYFVHFCCLFLKSLKAFSVSLDRVFTQEIEPCKKCGIASFSIQSAFEMMLCIYS